MLICICELQSIMIRYSYTTDEKVIQGLTQKPIKLNLGNMGLVSLVGIILKKKKFRMFKILIFHC